jgi:uncharacterized protein YjbJ (UPF0337 family)
VGVFEGTKGKAKGALGDLADNRDLEARAHEVEQEVAERDS